MCEQIEIDLAKIAFDAMVKGVRPRTYWIDLAEQDRNRWRRAAQAVKDALEAKAPQPAEPAKPYIGAVVLYHYENQLFSPAFVDRIYPRLALTVLNGGAAYYREPSGYGTDPHQYSWPERGE